MKIKKSAMELRKMVGRVHEDPELMEIGRNFVIRHGGRIPI